MKFEGREYGSMADVKNIAKFMQYLDSKKIIVGPLKPQPSQVQIDNPMNNCLAIDVNEVPVSKCEGAIGLLEEATKLSETEKIEFMQELVCREKILKDL